VLGVGAAIFFVGMISSLGYNGTTGLRTLSASGAKWMAFTQKIAPGDLAEPGKPFVWGDSGRPKINQGTAMFDTRLVDALNYLVSSKQSFCGADKAHDTVVISMGETDQAADTDLSYPPTNAPSTSTLYRGSGVRVKALDSVKCTIYPVNDRCSYKEPAVFDKKTIFLTQDFILSADKTYDSSACAVKCAVDYYPMAPIDAPKDEVAPVQSPDSLTKLNPGEFMYADIAYKAGGAAKLKMAQLMWELMKIDEPGCFAPGGLKGSDRLIPITMISSAWGISQLGDTWQELLKIANKSFPYDFQKQSPLAGLSFDPLLNEQGIHFNY